MAWAPAGPWRSTQTPKGSLSLFLSPFLSLSLPHVTPSHFLPGLLQVPSPSPPSPPSPLFVPLFEKNASFHSSAGSFAALPTLPLGQRARVPRARAAGPRGGAPREIRARCGASGPRPSRRKTRRRERIRPHRTDRAHRSRAPRPLGRLTPAPRRPPRPQAGSPGRCDRSPSLLSPAASHRRPEISMAPQIARGVDGRPAPARSALARPAVPVRRRASAEPLRGGTPRPLPPRRSAACAWRGSSRHVALYRALVDDPAAPTSRRGEPRRAAAPARGLKQIALRLPAAASATRAGPQGTPGAEEPQTLRALDVAAQRPRRARAPPRPVSF